MFLSNKVHTNKLVLHSELMIFIRYEDNEYCFMHYIQGNVIFYSIHAIFDEELFSKCTDFHIKEYKLYNKLLDKISPEIDLSAPDPSGKGGPAPAPTLHTSIPPIQNSSPTHSSLPSLSYKSISPLPIPRFKKPTIEIEENDNVDSDVEMQPPSSQQPLQPAL